MPNTKAIINNFTSGVQTPKLRARSDLKAYRHGAKTLSNVVIQRHGGVKRRGGSRFVDPVKDETTVHQFMDFVFSETQAYGVVLGNLYAWFTLNGSLLTETTFTISGAADNGSGLIRITTDSSHGYSNGDYVRIVGVEGTVEANGVWSISSASGTTFDLVGSTFTNTYSASASDTVGKIVEVTTPYLTADLPNLDWSQDGDVLHITGQNYAPRTLTRTSATSFTLAVKQFNKAPKQAQNTTATTITPSGTTGSITITASAALFTDTEATGHINSIWESNGGSWIITAFTSTTVVTATVINTLANTSALTTWNEADWSGTRGWPRRNTFYEGRWVTGPTTAKPQTVWGSALGGPLDFDQSTTNDDDPYEHKVLSNRINTIQWFSPQTTLLIGTTGSEFKAAGSNNGLLAPSNPIIRAQTSFGSTNIRPVLVGNRTIYVHRSGRRIYDIVFDFQVDAYDGDELNLLADHLLPQGTTVTRMAYQQHPDNTVWLVTSAGKLISMAYLPKQEVLGFSEHTLGGTDAVVEDVMVLPNQTTGDDDVYILVSRTINGATHRYIEYLDESLYVDSGLSGTHSPATSTLSGMNHLVGETVNIVGDMSPYATQTVSATGSVTVNTSENTISSSQVGLAMPTPTVTPNEIDPLVAQGINSFGLPKRPTRIYVRTIDTPTVAINGKQQENRSTQDNMDSPPPTPDQYDWDITELGYDNDAEITITQDQPLPFNVLGIFGRFATSD